MKKIIVLAFLLLIVSCAVQISSVPKINKTEICENNTAIFGISASYKMNMSTSKDVKFYLKETATGKIIEPQKRDDRNNNLYFSVSPGTYKIAMITITEPTISKTILFDDPTKKVIKFLGKIKVSSLTNPIHNGNGHSFSGTILTGDKNLIYEYLFSEAIRIQPNNAYYLGEYKFEGYIEGGFNDMPNIRISKIKPISPEKLESFKTIFKMAYLNSTGNIDTTTNLFKIDYIDLSKTNAIK